MTTWSASLLARDQRLTSILVNTKLKLPTMEQRLSRLCHMTRSGLTKLGDIPMAVRWHEPRGQYRNRT
jgi:hypothetical protein